MTTDAEASGYLKENFRRVLVDVPPKELQAAMVEFGKWLRMKREEGVHLADLSLSDPDVLGIIRRTYQSPGGRV
jgi:hypothetical protein